MNEIDIFEEDTPAETKQTNSKRLSKEEYAKKMKETRTALFNKANEQTVKAVSSDKDYLTYLQLQATLGYTITNTMLVMAEQPMATNLKDFRHWKNEGVNLKKGAKGIQILEPAGEFKRRDGSVGTQYNPKYVFDISQTSDALLNSYPHYETRDLIKAVTYKAEIIPEVVSVNSKLPRDVYYDETNKNIYVKERMIPEEMLKGLIHEYCRLEAKTSNRDINDFFVDSASYMVMAKYGVDTKDVGFAKDVNSVFKDVDNRQIRKELQKALNVFNKVTSRMEAGLYAHVEQKENKMKDNRER